MMLDQIHHREDSLKGSLGTRDLEIIGVGYSISDGGISSVALY